MTSSRASRSAGTKPPLHPQTARPEAARAAAAIRSASPRSSRAAFRTGRSCQAPVRRWTLGVDLVAREVGDDVDLGIFDERATVCRVLLEPELKSPMYLQL